MVERMEALPEYVVGFTAKGEVTGADYEKVIIPAVEEALLRHKEVRFLYHLGEEFTGFEAKALWDDAKVGMQHYTAWERVAIVTDVRWIRVLMQAFAFLIPGKVRLFHNSELVAARQWASEWP